MKGCIYRVVLRARNDGTWQVLFYNGKVRLFLIPFKKQSAAEFMAAKIVDELLRGRHEFYCNVQDENGQNMQLDLIGSAQRRKVRG